LVLQFWTFREVIMSGGPFDVLLCGPTEDEVRAVLKEAYSRVSVGYDDPSLRVALGKFAHKPEHWWYSVGSGSAFIAWWADHQGRKHLRVWIDRYDTAAPPRKAPPLARVFPDRAYRVTKPGQGPRWLVSCACGATGEPKALAWMGQRCGPCHDRIEEGQPYPGDASPTLFVEPGPGHTLAFSPDGTRLAVSRGRCDVRVYGLRDGSVTRLRHDSSSARDHEAYVPLAFSPDGRWLAGWHQEFLLIGFWDLLEEAPHAESTGLHVGEVLRHLAFSPDGQLFARCNDMGRFELSLADGGWYETDGDVPDSARLFAFSPDSRELATGTRDGIALHDTASWGRPRSRRLALDEREDWLFMQYAPDGGRLVLISGQHNLGWQKRRLHLLHLQGRKKTRTAELSAHLSRAALSPDGRFLAYVEGGKRAREAVSFWDLQSWSEAGQLAGDVDSALVDLAFSPDGQTLATVSHGGAVKLWPWRLLLA
jgi:hypothetical protein